MHALCAAIRSRRAGRLTGRGTAACPWARGRRAAAGCAARARWRDSGTARSPTARSDPRRARRAPDTAARPLCSTARGRRTRSATRARRRRDVAARRSPLGAGGTARRRRTSCCHRHSSSCADAARCRRRRATTPSCCSAPCLLTASVLPVLDLARDVVAALEQQDALAGRRQLVGERAAAGAAADDDDVVVRIGCHCEPRVSDSPATRHRVFWRRL